MSYSYKTTTETVDEPDYILVSYWTLISVANKQKRAFVLPSNGISVGDTFLLVESDEAGEPHRRKIKVKVAHIEYIAGTKDAVVSVKLVKSADYKDLRGQ